MPRMKRKMPVKRPKWKPYMLAYAILYGEFSWMERHCDGTVTIPVRRMCSQFKLTALGLREALEWLEGIGGLSMLKWNGHWFMTKPAVPKGMVRHIKESKEYEEDYVVEAITHTIENQYKHREEELPSPSQEETI